MIKKSSEHPIILALAPSSRGFGFAVLAEKGTLVDWGVKTANGDKNGQSILKVQRLIKLYQPELLVLPDDADEHSRRADRIKTLVERIISTAPHHGVQVTVLSRKQITQVFFANGRSTKHALAKIIASRYPDILARRLPPQRRPWMSEDYRMAIFEAVALALTSRLGKFKSK